jgi:hypothetical protein
MPRRLVVVLWLGACAYASAQSLDFPRAAATDSLQLEKSMAALAAQALAVYKADDRAKYLDTAFRLQLVAGKYDDALLSIADLRQLLSAQTVIPSRAAWVNVQDEVYARARLRVLAHGSSGWCRSASCSPGERLTGAEGFAPEPWDEVIRFSCFSSNSSEPVRPAGSQ